MRKKLSITLISCLLLACTSCGQKAEAPVTNEVQEETPAAEAVQEEAPAAETAEELAQASKWSSQGAFIDEKENHIFLYYTTVADGYPNDAWTVTALFGEKFYGGEMQEQDGVLTGVVTNYDENSNPVEDMKITLREDSGNVIFIGEDGSESVYAPDNTDYAAMAGEMLPMFSYNSLYAFEEPDNLAAAAYDYLAFDYKFDSEAANVVIPYVDIVGVDNTDPKDVLVYGSYYLWEFKKEDDTLVAVSGGHYPGVIHMERFGEVENAAYSAFSMDEAFTDSDVEPLFKEHYDAYIKASSDDKKRNAGIAQVVADYVHANNLPVTKYQMFGSDPQELPPSHAGEIPGN